jgi:dihydroneopterin aldolase
MTIELAGLEIFGHHGVDEDERREGQPFLFDVWLDVAEDAARSDRIEDAVDYRGVAALVRGVAAERQFRLLETLAAAAADAIVERFDVRRVRVRVRKPRVSLGVPVEWSAVTVERSPRP